MGVGELVRFAGITTGNQQGQTQEGEHPPCHGLLLPCNRSVASRGARRREYFLSVAASIRCHSTPARACATELRQNPTVMVSEPVKTCPLCEREVEVFSDHHLVPKSRGGRETQAICLDCHGMIHTLFDNKRLERELNTVQALLAEPSFAKYISWVSKRSSLRRHKAKRPYRSARRG